MIKKRFVVILFGCLFAVVVPFVSCGSSEAVDVVNKFLKAEDQIWNTGDGSALMEVEDPNIEIFMIGMPPMKGNQAHVDAITGIRKGTPGITHVWSDVTGSGNIGAFRFTEKFKLGDKEVSYDGAMFLHIKNGKVVKLYSVYDSLTLMKAFGVVQDVPPPAAPKKK